MKDVETTEEILPATQELPALQHGVFADDPLIAIEQAEALVRAVSSRCVGPKFVCKIKGRDYPKVEWWTTVGAVLNLFPVILSAERVDRDNGEYLYLAKVEVRRDGNVVTSAEAICSNAEKRWNYADEYAIKSMAQTRAVAKAYRIGLSFLATLAGLEATPAEEVPPNGFESPPKKKPEKKFDTEHKKFAKRMHNYFLAKANESDEGAQKLFIALLKDLDITGKKMFNDLTNGQIDQMWMKICHKVEDFEKATTAK